MRAGLTGLGLVFLATLAASVVFAPDVAPAPKEPTEPLAQLGVAPGPEKNGAATRPPLASPEALPQAPPAAPAPAPPDALVPDAATLPVGPGDPPPISI